MYSRRKKILISLVIASLALIVVGVLQLNKKDVVTVSEGSAGVVYLNDHGKLQDMLFDLQYYAVQAALSDYITAKISPNVTSAELIGDASVPSDGMISFKVRISNPDKTIAVNLDRQTHFDKIIFSIEGSSYKKTLSIYEDSAPNDIETNEMQ